MIVDFGQNAVGGVPDVLEIDVVGGVGEHGDGVVVRDADDAGVGDPADDFYFLVADVALDHDDAGLFLEEGQVLLDDLLKTLGQNAAD